MKACLPYISKDILATVGDDIYKLGLLEAERFVTKREVRLSMTFLVLC
jgi:hypothetical protein